MKINHNNLDVEIDYSNCSSCYFHGTNYLYAVLPRPCWTDNHSYKVNTKNSDIFNI